MPAKAERSAERNTSSTNLRLQSPAVSVKKESIETPEPMPRNKPDMEINDEATRATIEALTNERGLRSTRKSSEPKPSPPPGPPKRRGGKNNAVAKKLPSKRAPASKKRKVKAETATSADNSPTTNSRTASATKKRNSQAGTPVQSNSPAAEEDDNTSVEESPAGSDGEDEIYCICRRPDDHKYMIGCDGGCDNWFHGACVNITEAKGKLIDKYICERCAAVGKGCTTWKPMCRRDGCGLPARIGNVAAAGAGPSKYCSDECGQRLFAERVRSAAAEKPRASRKRRSAAAANASDSDSDGEAVAPMSRAGPLRAPALSALARAASSGASFRALGGTADSFSPSSADAPDSALTPAERASLRAVAAKKEALRAARAALAERARFLERARAAATAAAEKAGGKSKEFCGFDARLAWSAARWGAGKENEEPAASNGVVNGASNGVGGADVDMADAGETPAPESGLMCTRRRCERHKLWPRLMLDDLRFEEAMQADRMRELDRAEREIHDVASRRWREEVSGVGERLGFVVMAADEMEVER
jgi:COMPASS component SPP1